MILPWLECCWGGICDKGERNDVPLLGGDTEAATRELARAQSS